MSTRRTPSALSFELSYLGSVEHKTPLRKESCDNPFFPLASENDCWSRGTSTNHRVWELLSSLSILLTGERQVSEVQIQ